MAIPVSQLLGEQSTNYVQHTGLTTGTDKKWAKNFHPLVKFNVHSWSSEDDPKTVYANWDGPFLPLFADDEVRIGMLSSRPNQRRYRLATEEDCAVWFHTEVSNIVLSAWSTNPDVLQTNQPKPRDEDSNVLEMVDAVYALAHRKLHHRPLAIGEWKRNLIDPRTWKSGRMAKSGAQFNLSRELRGYAVKYKCPQVFCFDGETLLLLQFRAVTFDGIKNEDCPVDCWVIPRRNGESGETLRYALYRFLVQGFRRCQGLAGVEKLSVNGYAPSFREFFSGLPVFQIGDTLSYEHPQNSQGFVFDREVDIGDGSFFWRFNGQKFTGDDGAVVRDTKPMWQPDAEAEEEDTPVVAGPSTSYTY